MEIQQRDNETLTTYVHHFKTAVNWGTFDNDTVVICIFVMGLWDAQNTTPKIYREDPQTFSEVIRIVEKFNAAEQLTTTLTPSTVSMMSNDDTCFVCGQTGHFHHHCPDGQCYSCDEFGHFALDCHSRIPLSGTPFHQDRSPSRPWYTHTWRNRSQYIHYRHRKLRHFNWLQSHCWSHCKRSSRCYRRNTSCSPSSHCRGLCYPSTDRCLHHQDTPYRHCHTPSQTCHFSH